MYFKIIIFSFANYIYLVANPFPPGLARTGPFAILMGIKPATF